MLRLILLPLLALGLASAAAAQGVDARRAAVEATLAQAPACKDLGDLYWEIGDRNGRLAGGQRGSGVTATRPLRIASASKWLWGAYVAERQQGGLSGADIAFLTMSSGYTGVNPLRCQGRVADCRGDGRDLAKSGHFYYDSGHAQQQAVTLGLGHLDGPSLASEMRRVLGAELDFTFRSPQPAGGAIMAPAAYGRFLRKLAAGELRLSGLLGSHAVCTLPGTCPSAGKSPLNRDWHYSLHHWVEDADGGDGAVSSAGAFGFYPWISADRSTWGLLAREETTRRAGRASADCGALVRRAWFAGMAQGGGAQTGGTAAQTAAGRNHPLRDALRQRVLDRGR